MTALSSPGGAATLDGHKVRSVLTCGRHKARGRAVFGPPVNEWTAPPGGTYGKCHFCKYWSRYMYGRSEKVAEDVREAGGLLVLDDYTQVRVIA